MIYIFITKLYQINTSTLFLMLQEKTNINFFYYLSIKMYFKFEKDIWTILKQLRIWRNSITFAVKHCLPEDLWLLSAPSKVQQMMKKSLTFQHGGELHRVYQYQLLKQVKSVKITLIRSTTFMLTYKRTLSQAYQPLETCFK